MNEAAMPPSCCHRSPRPCGCWESCWGLRHLHFRPFSVCPGNGLAAHPLPLLGWQRLRCFSRMRLRQRGEEPPLGAGEVRRGEGAVGTHWHGHRYWAQHLVCCKQWKKDFTVACTP